MKELYDMEDLQALSEMFEQFGMIEEQQAVWKCFASDERSKITKFTKCDEYTKTINPVKVDYLKGEELEAFLKWCEQ